MRADSDLRLRNDSPERRGRLYARLALLTAATTLAILEQGARDPVAQTIPLAVLMGLAATSLLVWAIGEALARGGWRTALIFLPETSAALLTWTAGWIAPGGLAALFCAWTLLILLRLYLELMERVQSKSLLFVAGFAGLIFLGAAALKLPIAVPAGSELTWLDAIFTSTSAVCVTGLIVRDTATEFTRFGQVVILALIQLGGLGIVTYAAFVVLLTGRTLNLRILGTVGGAAAQDQASPIVVRRLVRFIVISTVLIEAVGALCLLDLLPEGAAWPERLFTATFMSISAFCNAGFAVFSDSLAGRRWSVETHAVIAPLIVLGGLGFPVLMNLHEVLWPRLWRVLRRAPRWERGPQRRLSLHTKLVLLTTLGLYLLGTGAILVGQTGSDSGSADSAVTAVTPDDLTPGQRLLDASFLSVTARTAGFNAMPMEELAPSSRFVTILLMFVGGSPGSTAGGVKTITLAVLVLLVWSTLRQRPGPEALGRCLPPVSVQRAATLVTLGFLSVALVITLLRFTEGKAEAAFTFEAVSACSTVGLSLDVTPTLSSAGRVVLMLAMFAGRLGPLALLAALLVRQKPPARYEFPEEGVVVG
jgi:trk/ktr system potassium uptake protein